MKRQHAYGKKALTGSRYVHIAISVILKTSQATVVSLKNDIRKLVVRPNAKLQQPVQEAAHSMQVEGAGRRVPQFPSS